MNEEKKYILATIKIPIEIFNEKEYEILKDYFNIEFSQCNKEELPCKNEITTISQYFHTILNDLFTFKEIIGNTNEELEHEQEQPPPPPLEQEQEQPQPLQKIEILPNQYIYISKNKLKQRRTKTNISFKNKKNQVQRYTCKIYNNNY